MSTEGPLVSVLTPVRDEGRYLDEMLRSIRSQSYQSFELVLVDDGSVDESLAIMMDHANEDTRLRVKETVGKSGIVEALNLGLQHCHGKYVARMDADDVAFQNRLEKQVDFLEANPEVAVLGAAVEYIGSDGQNLGRIRRSDITRSLLRRNPLLHPTVIIRRNVLQEFHFVYRSEFEYAEDYFLWLEISKVSKIATINDVVLYYRMSDSSLRAQKLKAMIRATIRVKISGYFRLRIRASVTDALVLILELILLLVPSSLIWRVYSRLGMKSGFAND